MIEQVGDLWDAYDAGYWIAVTTNRVIRVDGTNVMGKGIALQAKKRFPSLPKRIAEGLLESGNHVQVFTDIRLITFPTKGHWRYQSPLWLVERSAREAAALKFDPAQVVLPRPGCGEGGLNWENMVRPIVSRILDDRFVVMHLEKK